MSRIITIILLFFTLFSANAFASGTIKGIVKNANEDAPMIGATVFLVGENLGTRTDKEGAFEIKNLLPGTYNVRATFTGYSSKTITVTIKDGEERRIEFLLYETTIMTKSVEAVASRAKTRETPVAVSEIPKEILEMKLGSRDLPMILNETPGVYATEQGGGYGDSRINIRGFDQRNIAVMINGVPVNDMENGWVYWSNWAGLKDVTSSVQVQRGLGAGNLGNPSVGGTMNYTTDAAGRKAGASFRQEYGSGAYLKSTIIGHTGKLDNGFAASVVGSRTIDDGIISNTWTDAWAYYLALSWDVNTSHQLDFYLTGAPQQHGQRSWRETIGTYDVDYARELGVYEANPQADAFDLGILYNSNWGFLNAPGSENVQIFANGEVRDRRFNDRIAERENYFHKPQMNFNWFWQIASDLSLTNVFYLSTGNGGGSGSYGTFVEYDSLGLVDFNKVYERNTSFEAVDPRYSSSERKSETILRNSVNNHLWYGYLGTANYQIDKSLNITFGLDGRYYKGEHFMEVRSLLGGDYFINSSNRNDPNQVKRLGDKISYYNDGIVTNLGGFATGEYKVSNATIYLNTSILNAGYQRIDYFRQNQGIAGAWETDVQNFIGYTLKTGANYNINKNLNVFANAGYYSRPPLFRNVFSNFNTVYQNVTNEKVTSFEIGGGWWSRKLTLDVNAYYAQWRDRGWSTSSQFEQPDGSVEYIDYNLQGLDAIHMGVEFEAKYKPTRWLNFKGVVSLGDWTYQNDVFATFAPENNPEDERTTNLALDGLKVGDAAQKQFVLSTTVNPVRGSYINVTYRYFTDNYAYFDPEDRVYDPNYPEDADRRQSWKLPNFGIMDLHFGYTLPLDLPIGFKITGHVFNLLDELYITDASDNTVGADHDAASAVVYFGRPQTFNLGIEIRY